MMNYLLNRIKEKREQRLIFLMQLDECRSSINQLQERYRTLDRNIVMTDAEMGELNNVVTVIKNNTLRGMDDIESSTEVKQDV